MNNVPLIRRGQDSNLQSSGHEPDELTNSSTPLLPLLFRTEKNNVRLACVKHIASVPSEPGSNSSFDYDWALQW